CAALLIERFGGQVPRNVSALKRLPGVGHYAAQAVRCFGFGEPGWLVDTNTIRVASRICGAEPDIAAHRTRRVQKLVQRLRDDGDPPGAEDNFALLDLAGLVCLTSQPRCTE